GGDNFEKTRGPFLLRADNICGERSGPAVSTARPATAGELAAHEKEFHEQAPNETEHDDEAMPQTPKKSGRIIDLGIRLGGTACNSCQHHHDQQPPEAFLVHNPPQFGSRRLPRGLTISPSNCHRGTSGNPSSGREWNFNPICARASFCR